jgi:hypothetical protein
MKQLTIKELNKLNYYELRNLKDDLRYSFNLTEKESKYLDRVEKVLENKLK